MFEPANPINVSPRVPLGGDYWEADPGVPLWGFADLHAHLMAHLAFGGNGFWGKPFDPDHLGEEGMQYVMGSCEPLHGRLLDLNPEFGHPAGGGWPDFIIWPRFTTLIHQQAYVDWLYRSYQGGLRLVSCLAVNNEILGSKSDAALPIDDRSAIQAQMAGMKAMVSFVDGQCGGAGKGWIQIAYSPNDARRIIRENKLAVILGIEVDSFGNWRRIEDLREACHGNLNQARFLIGLELDWLYGLGVRQITPIHLTNNAFGGTAIYDRFLETFNVFISGEPWTVEDAWHTGIRYRMDQDEVNLVGGTKRGLMISGGRSRDVNRRTMADHIPGLRTILDSFSIPTVSGGHANTRGLTQYGIVLLEEMMKRGMVIDIDHMSQKATDSTLDLAEANQYPVMTSHSWFRDLLFSGDSEFSSAQDNGYRTSSVHKVAHEGAKSANQIERIAALGGMISAILNQGDIAGLRRAMPELASKISAPCAGTSTAWAEAYLYMVAKMGGQGVALGSDINGAACLPGPRFGTFAAYGAHDDAQRIPQRRAEIDCQKNGVAYRTPIRDYRWHRFEPSGEGGYNEECCNIWHAVAQFAAGFNPSIHKHPKNDFPDLKLQQLQEAIGLFINQDWIDNITRGIRLAVSREAVSADEMAEWPREQRVAYFAVSHKVEDTGINMDDHTRELVGEITEIWQKWQEMQGDNPPLERSTAGPRRDFDINIDGMAHYGMLPDFLQDMRNSGLSADDLAPLFRSAYDYIEMWDTCIQRAKEISV